MTPCEKLGYKVGDTFELTTDIVGFQKGSVATLREDFGTDHPMFEINGSITGCDLDLLRPVTKADEVAHYSSPNTTQVGGTHYKDLKIQPWEVMESWNREHFIGFLRYCILKRVGRWDSKDGALMDMKKARHELDKMIEMLEEE
jgi:hypothetical protein